jgi:hypothetical protein
MGMLKRGAVARVPAGDHRGGPDDRLPTSSDDRRMVEMITGFWVSQLVRAVVELNLADGCLSVAQLTERSGRGGQPRRGGRIRRALPVVRALQRPHRYNAMVDGDESR